MTEEPNNQSDTDAVSVVPPAEAPRARNEGPFSKEARFLIVSACIVIIVAGMHAASDILAPILLGFVLAIVIVPMIDWLRRKGLPNWLAWLIIALGLLAIGLAVIGILLASVSEFADRLPAYEEALAAQLASIETWLASLGIDLPELPLLVQTNVNALIRTGAGFVGVLVSSLYGAGLVLFVAVLFLLGAPGLSSRLWESGPDESSVANRFVRFSEGVQQNMLGLTLNNAATAFAITVWLTLFRVDFALLWGLLSFFLGYIPNIGMIIAAIPPILLTFVLYGLETAVIVTIGLIVIISILNFVTNALIGQGVDLSVAAVFITFIFWTWVLGPLGSLLAFPMTIALKIALESNEETRWLAAMMSATRFHQENRDR